MSTLRDAQARYESAVTGITNARKAIRDAEMALYEAEAEERKAHLALVIARAAASSDHYATGTRVRHSGFPEIKGTVVKSDGTGVAVLQDGQEEVRYGFGASEWVPEITDN